MAIMHAPLVSTGAKVHESRRHLATSNSPGRTKQQRTRSAKEVYASSSAAHNPVQGLLGVLLPGQGAAASSLHMPGKHSQATGHVVHSKRYHSQGTSFERATSPADCPACTGACWHTSVWLQQHAPKQRPAHLLLPFCKGQLPEHAYILSSHDTVAHNASNPLLKALAKHSMSIWQQISGRCMIWPVYSCQENQWTHSECSKSSISNMCARHALHLLGDVCFTQSSAAAHTAQMEKPPQPNTWQKQQLTLQVLVERRHIMHQPSSSSIC